MKPDVSIQALPIDGEAMYVLSRVDQMMKESETVQIASSLTAVAKLLEFTFTEYVSPQAPESLFSLYVSGGKPDPILVRRLNELTDLLMKMEHLLSIHRRAIDSAVINRVGTCVNQKQRDCVQSAWKLLRLAGRPVTTVTASAPVGQAVPTVLIAPAQPKVAPPLPFHSPQPPAVCAPLPFKIPPPMVTAKYGKSIPPPVMGKGAAPALPHMPTKAVMGKAGAPSIPLGKGSAPNLPIPHMSPPTLPRETLREVAVFEVPLISVDVAETRKIHWQSIPVSRFKNSLFATRSGDDVDLDLSLVNEHFVKTRTCMSPTASPSRVPTAACSPMSSAAALTVPSVLETRRIQQIEIFLNGRRGFSAADIVRLLKTGGEESVTTVDLLEAVSALYPTAEEQALLESVPGKSKDGLGVGKADSFLMDLVAIPDFQLVVNYVVVLHTVKPAACETIEYFKKLNLLFESLTASTELANLLALVGKLVVYLWNGKKPTFNGFAVEMISQLRKIASFVDKDYSVLHCVVDIFPSPDLEKVLTLLAPTQELIDFDFADLVLRADEVQKSVNLIKPERLNNTFYPALVSRLCRFKTQMESDVFPELVEQKELVMHSSTSLLRYFAESDKKSINEFLGNLNSLRNDLVHVRMQNEKRKKQLPRSVGAAKT